MGGMDGMRMQKQEDGSEEGNGKARMEGVAEAIAVDVAVEGADAGACVESGAGWYRIGKACVLVSFNLGLSNVSLWNCGGSCSVALGL
jgi:hypothetical protein